MKIKPTSKNVLKKNQYSKHHNQEIELTIKIKQELFYHKKAIKKQLLMTKMMIKILRLYVKKLKIVD